MFVSGNYAQVRAPDCTGCGHCQEVCAFEAVALEEDGPAVIDPMACEGCKLCVVTCPEEAIDFPERECGQWMVSDTRFGTMVHAQLYPGQENSGRLVSLLRQEARQLAEQQGHALILADGTPGIGCPVISSLSGTDLALVVTEPTLSGVHDLERVLELCEHFRVPAKVVINKADLNPAMTSQVEEACRRWGVEVVARLEFDPEFVQAVVAGRTLVEQVPQGRSAGELRSLWSRLETALQS